jgi:hypothetical protein
LSRTAKAGHGYYWCCDKLQYGSGGSKGPSRKFLYSTKNNLNIIIKLT